MVKPAELKDLNDDELQTRLTETREELFNLRFQNATGQLDNYKRVGLLRKDVARIETAIRERELQSSGAEESTPRWH